MKIEDAEAIVAGIFKHGPYKSPALRSKVEDVLDMFFWIFKLPELQTESSNMALTRGPDTAFKD